MGVLAVLGLQLCLLAFSLGSPVEWAVSETVGQNKEDQSIRNPPAFETGNEALYFAEAPEFEIEVNHQDPQDYDITLMTHRVRRSEGSRKKKKSKSRAGAYSSLGSSRMEDGPGNLLQHPNPQWGKTSVIGKAGEPEVVRAKRELDSRRRPGKKYQGKYSLVSSLSLPITDPTESINQESKDAYDYEY